MTTAAGLLKPHEVLRGQAEVLGANLRRCRDTLAAPGLDALLPVKLRKMLAAELDAQERDLGRLLGRVGPDSRQELLWEDLEDRSREVEQRISEVLALLSGALVRGAKLDGDLCAIADALLDELSDLTRVGWVRLTILAPQESYAQRAQIIHLRFPEFTVWALPLAAHEFGHLVAQDLRELRDDGSYEQLVATEIADSELSVAHARELFADVLATYVLGPAYAATAILLRFRPSDAGANDDRSTHPNDGKRVHAMLHALRTLSAQKPVDQPYHAVASGLERTWSDVVRATGGDPVLDEETAGRLDYLVDHVFLSLLQDKLGAARYDSLGQARVLARELGRGAALPEPHDVRMTDVLNAAWLARLREGGDGAAVDAAGSDALELLRRIAAMAPPTNRGSGA